MTVNVALKLRVRALPATAAAPLFIPREIDLSMCSKATFAVALLWRHSARILTLPPMPSGTSFSFPFSLFLFAGFWYSVPLYWNSLLARERVCAESHFKLDCWKKSLFRLNLSCSPMAHGMLTDDADWAPETEFTAADHSLRNLFFLRRCPQLIF